MIDDPGIQMTAEVSDSWSIEGLLAKRVESVVDRLREQFAASGVSLPSARLRVLAAPAEHVGLGVGTQLALAVTSALWHLTSDQHLTLPELARLSGRGVRSGIGLHGFRHGGLIVDGGRKSSDRSMASDRIPPLLSHVEFPTDWRILVIRPSNEHGLYGQAEIRAFQELPAIDRGTTDRLCQLVLLELLPAVIERDLESFGAAIRGIQASVGASFAQVQGGVYSSSTAMAIIAELTAVGFVGAGQSSWGPTLYAFSNRPEPEVAATGETIRLKFNLEPGAVFSTRGNNVGAEIQRNTLL
jgi:beta-RFAP synthase